MVTLRKAMTYRDRATGITETILPGRDFIVTDHDVVRRQPEAFKRAIDPMTPAGREERKLLRELAAIERQRRQLEGLALGRMEVAVALLPYASTCPAGLGLGLMIGRQPGEGTLLEDEDLGVAGADNGKSDVRGAHVNRGQ
jgi:hypothetical protein